MKSLGTPAAIITIISTLGIIWIVVEYFRSVLGNNLTDTIQVTDAIIALVYVVISAGQSVHAKFQQLPTPVGIKEFANLFSEASEDRAEFLRDSLPKLIDFKEDYIVSPPETLGKILNALLIKDGVTYAKAVDKVELSKRFHAATTAGPPGCGKTTTAYRLGYDLKQKGWNIYFGDASYLFVNTTIEEIKKWFMSLRGKVLFVIDNTHLNGDHVIALIGELNDCVMQQHRILPITYRLLCLETLAYIKPVQQKKVSTVYIAGTRVERIPILADDSLGFVGVHIERRFPSTQIAGSMSTLFIEEGREIAETIFNRFVKIYGQELTFDFETIFVETGTVVELCETLKRIMRTDREDSSLSLETPWVDIPRYAVARRVRSLQNPQNGVVLLGLVSSFTQVGSIVAREFIETVIGNDISQTVSELESDRHIVRSYVGPAMREFLLLTHQIVAALIRKGSSEVLTDMYSIDNDIDVRRKLFGNYLDFLNALPPRTSKRIGSSFLLCVSSFSASHDIEKLVDFVSEQCSSFSDKDINIMYSLYNAAIYYMTKGRFEESKKLFKEALVLNPEFHQARLNLGMTLMFNNELEEARDELELIVQKVPTDVLALANLARVLHLLGDSDRALELLQSASGQSPKDARIKQHQAKIEFELGRLDAALSHIEESLEIDSEDSESYATLGQILLSKGENEKAEQILGDAVKRGLESLALLNNLGAAIKRQGRLQEAKRYILRCLEINQTYAVALANMGDILYKEGKLTEAQEYVSRALESDPNYPIAHALQGILFWSNKEYKKAKKSLEKAIRLGHKEPDTIFALALCHYELNEFTRFRSRIEQALKLSKNPILLLIDVVQFCRSKKDNKSVDEFVPRVTKLVNEIMSTKQYDLAEPALEKLSKTQPKSFEIWANLGTVRASLGKLKKALDAFERAIEIYSRDARLWHNKGNVLKELGDDESAEKAYAKARSLTKKTDYDFYSNNEWNWTS